MAIFHLFRLHNFYYELGDCLFNELGILVHFFYTPIEIIEGIVNHFLSFLDQKGVVSLSLLNKCYYIIRMNVIICFTNKWHIGNILWGGIFLTKCFSKWLNVPIFVWSLIKEKDYLHYNSKDKECFYNLLFHDQNPSVTLNHSYHYTPFNIGVVCFLKSIVKTGYFLRILILYLSIVV